MRTLDEAIQHATDVAYRNEKKAQNQFPNPATIAHRTCMECAADHRQLAEWLKELKQRRERDETD